MKILSCSYFELQSREKKQNGGIDITIDLHIVFTGHAVGFTRKEIYTLQGHVHGNLCLARA